MSLLANGPHTVTVYPQESGEDFHGNVIERPSATPVTITGCLMQPINAGHIDVSQGQHARVEYRLLTRSAPIGAWSRVEWVDDQGTVRKFAVIEQPSTRRFTSATSHVTALLREER